MGTFRKLAVSTVLLALSLAGFAQSPTTDVRASVEHVLLQQVDAWNRPDLEGFMAGYWKSPELTFFSNGEVTSGW
jgi:hypothetical protein